MHVVAIVELKTPIEVEAKALGEDLGTIAYEARLILNAGFPAVVLKTVDKDLAQQLLLKLRARGQVAVAYDADRMVSHDRMVTMRQFVLDPDGIVLTDREGIELPYGDILAILRATHRTRTETETQVSEKKFSVGRAVLTGGLLHRKAVKSEERTIAHHTEQVAYLFRASGDVPWFIRERGANYAPLGKDLTPSSATNFLTLIARLRELAPQAVYDDRLMAQRNVGGRVARTTTQNSESQTVSSAGGVDLLAHLIALSVAASDRED